MDLVLAVVTYFITFLFFSLYGEALVFKELKKCKKKTLLISNNSVEFYECPAEDYYSFRTFDGKRLLFRGKECHVFAYYHELGHLIYDNFLLDTLLTSAMVLPLFLLRLPWSLLAVVMIYIALKWHKKMEERRADLFAHEMTGLKYTADEVEKNRITLILHWLFWSHPPEKVRSSEEYYKKEISLFRLFINSVLD